MTLPARTSDNAFAMVQNYGEPWFETALRKPGRFSA
jgi:hypothetical protein